MGDSEKNEVISTNWAVRPPSKEFLGLGPSVRDVIASCLSECPVKLGKMAKNLNIRVMLSTLPYGTSGKISSEKNEFIIRINRHEPKYRQRFTLAHEISHYLLHREKIKSSEEGWSENVLLRSNQSLDVEYEANRLASDLIVPSEQLSKMTESMRGKPMTDAIVDSLAQQFGVSRATMEIKLQMC